jgi:hypothetical protein
LRNRLAGLDVREIIGWAASAMAISVDDWHRVRTAAHQSLATAKAVQTHTENATAVQVVLELAARLPVAEGGRAPTRRDLEALAILAHDWWRWRSIADRTAVRLATVTSARLTRRGTFDVVVADRAALPCEQVRTGLPGADRGLRSCARCGRRRPPSGSAALSERGRGPARGSTRDRRGADSRPRP